MRASLLRRMQALLLTAVLLVGGNGASALDVALYHLGGHAEAPAPLRLAGTDAPRSHGDTCILLDRAARGPYAVTLDALPIAVGQTEARRARAAPPDVPRAASRLASPQSRAPPVLLT